MMKNDPTLPTPRELLTSLITSLTSIPLPATSTSTFTSTSTSTSSNLPTAKPPNPQASTIPAPSNPLRHIPAAHRPVLTTLHVLYPGTLLPALDLLDRRLVTRVVLQQQQQQQQRQGITSSAAEIQDDSVGGGNSSSRSPNAPKQQANKNTNTTTATAGTGKPPTPPPPIYHLVHSAQQPPARRHQQAAPRRAAYVVRLAAWNCTCAAFAFSAFPPSLSSTITTTTTTTGGGGPDRGYRIFSGVDADADTGPGGSAEWEFGGISMDGRDGDGGVPCCKHLLACVLAERWGAVLGGYVRERLVSREESAGLVGDS
ncbi:putative ubiquitin carboxyl-terminal hydrolase family protein [Rosellinia necatrix]|uniref:Putative ubiquitin carboxyl-terminal hydrolase family protein n=1 Tax=Rosellinia necatrix TaxID=77044 RepID=A0A1W2TKZ6_ROSNE|nr:putative ubiquitin carboxyl-terminal hydrolase family protein [Rosellinia necatrix]